MTTSTIQPELAEALNRLWAEFLPEIGERVNLLRNAALDLRAGILSKELRQAASQAAHKLAGVLGTFGLEQGTDLAREAELMLTAKSKIPADTAARLGTLAEQIHNLIAQRCTATSS